MKTQVQRQEGPRAMRLRWLVLLLVFGLAVGGGGQAAFADFDTSDVRVNQVGYFPAADKVASVINSSTSPLNWEVREASSGNVAANGSTSVYGQDQASGDHIHHADFSSVQAEGNYVLWVEGEGESVPFTIGTDLYQNLPAEAMNYFYFHRMGEDIQASYLPNSAFARQALHPGDDQISCYNDWCNGDVLDVRYSWADAGDYGIYAVNQAISAWTLLNFYERYPEAFADGSLNIPENSNGIPDIVDEVNFGSTFMQGMLPSSGLASHKVHNDQWSAFPVTDVGAENAEPRAAQPPSTNATYAVARNLSQLARVIEPYDASRASSLWATAKEAWDRANANPNVDYTGSTSDAEGGGDYGDEQNSDDQYAAAVEMYLTAHALGDGDENTYQNAVTSSQHYKEVSHFDWKTVAGAGTLSLLSVSNDLPSQDIADIESNLISHVDGAVNTLNGEGYPVPLPGSEEYPWGSNSFVVNKMVLMGYAYDISDDPTYFKAMNRTMDYLMGTNAMKISYITGYGEYYETDTHDRWAWGKYQSGISYPKGWLSGGPNSELVNDSATPTGVPAAKSYADKDTAPDAWASKENTINWNAPLAWVSKYINDHQSDLGADPGDTTPPAAPESLTAVPAGETQIDLNWSDNTENDWAGYNVYRSTTSGMIGSPIAEDVSSSQYSDTNATCGTTYYYVVTAEDTSGNESDASNEVQAATDDCQGDTTPPAAPSGLTATDASESQIDLDWSDNTESDLNGYRVYRGTNSGFTADTSHLVASDVTSSEYSDTGLSTATTYYYVVKAVDRSGNVSSASDEGSATTQEPDTGGDLAVQYRAGNTNENDNQIKPHFTIVNQGDSAVSMDELTLRYWYTNEGDQAQNFNCDWAVAGCSNLTGDFVSVSGSANGADTYLEISFASGAGQIGAGDDSGEMQIRFHKTDWSNYDESDDYSFDSSKSAFTDWDHVTLYRNGSLVWGMEP